jgi:hypothetical protein
MKPTNRQIEDARKRLKDVECYNVPKPLSIWNKFTNLLKIKTKQIVLN